MHVQRYSSHRHNYSLVWFFFVIVFFPINLDQTWTTSPVLFCIDSVVQKVKCKCSKQMLKFVPEEAYCRALKRHSGESS
jgi:hypothetical protein